jgi:MFS family permease
MGQLIAFRAVQGIGGGGLTIGAQAIIGELIAPRERGRYIGAFFGMFGLASVAGPLLGGYLTDAWSWRWCFYVNLPLGALTLAIVTAVLHLPRHTTRPRLDYLGAALLAAAVTCMVLVTSWGGTRYAWASPTVLVLGLVAAVLLGAFVLAERRADAPVVPLRLFRSRVFNVANGLGLVIGVVPFGAIIYIPAFFQMAQGASATEAGLRMLPMIAGVLAAAVWSGQRISATGTYRRFPIAGMALGAPGLALLSRLEADTPYPLASSFLLVLGVGTGLSMQVLVLAVQNAACGCRLVASRRRLSVRYPACWPSDKAMARARSRIRELTGRRRWHIPIHKLVADLNQFLRGWRQYHRWATRRCALPASTSMSRNGWRCCCPNATPDEAAAMG